MQAIDRHIRFLQEFDRRLQSWSGIELSYRRKRIVETRSAGTVQAPYLRIDKDRISYRESTEAIGRYLLWQELTPSSRLDLLIEAGPPDLLLIYSIALLEWTQRGNEAAPLWEQLEEKSRSEMQSLLKDTRNSD